MDVPANGKLWILFSIYKMSPDSNFTSLKEPNIIGVLVHSPLGGAAAEPKTVFRSSFCKFKLTVLSIDLCAAQSIW